MVIKLDLKDKKILYELDINSRVSYSKLSKKIKLKKETIRYRIQNLIKNGVIVKFQTIIDSSKLGINYYKIFFKLQANINTRNQIIKYLSSNERVTWVGKVDGVYDLGINLLTENLYVLNTFLSNLYEQFPNKIIEKNISSNLYGHYFNRDYLINNKRQIQNIKKYSSKIKNIYKIDEIDFDILLLLCSNSRISTVEIGKKLNISHDSALYRLKKLEKEKIITGYTIVLNNEIIGQLNYKILIYLRIYSNNSIQKIINFLSNFNEVTYIVKSLGNWDLDFEVEVNDVQKLREILVLLTNEFSDIIQKYDSLLIYEFQQYNFFPQRYKFKTYKSEIKTY